jgi:hypothetical protein
LGAEAVRGRSREGRDARGEMEEREGKKEGEREREKERERKKERSNVERTTDGTEKNLPLFLLLPPYRPRTRGT